jgi:hypothetical protein
MRVWLRRYRATGGPDSVAQTHNRWCGTFHALQGLRLRDQPQQVLPPLVSRDRCLPALAKIKARARIGSQIRLHTPVSL